MATIITKNSSTASAAPAVGDLTKGELAVNVTDKKLYTKDNSAAIVKIVGSLGNQEANAVAITGGSVTGITDITVADGGTGASSAADARTNLGVTATGADTAYAFRSNNLSDLASASTARTNLGLGTIATQAASSVTITGGSVTGITDITVADGGTGASTAANARTNLGLVIGTDVLAPNGSAANLTSFPTLNQNTTGNAATVTTNANLTGAVTSVGNATSLGSFSSANLLGALTDETGTGSAVFATSPTLVTPILGTPTSATLTNATGLPISTGVSGLGTGVATALAVNVGSAGAPLVNGGVLGTPSSGTATNLTGLPISTGVSGLGTGVATALAVNVGSAGAPVVNGGALGTPSSGTATNLTGLPLSTGVTGTLPVANGGTGQTSYTDGQLLIGNSTGNTLTKATLTAGSGITVTNSAGGITIAATGGGGSGDVVGPASATDNAFTRFDGTTGKLIQNSTGATLSDTGGATFTGSVDVAGTSTAGSNIKLYEDTDNGTNYVSFKAPDTIAANVTWTLPAADGTSSQVLQTNGSGVLSFATVSGGGSPGGSTTQVQYNNAGAFGGITGATTNGTALTLVAPVLGTPASATLTNATGLPLTTGVTGTLPTANGGTNLGGATPFTSSGVVYASSASALATGSALTFNGTDFTFQSAIKLLNNDGGGNKAILSTHLYGGSGATGTLTLASTYGNSNRTQIKVGVSGLAATSFEADSVEVMRITSTGLKTKTTISVGDATPSTSGAGITFPATQSASSDANTLDDYEEGTWSPTIEGTSVAGTATYSTRNGRYTKTGRMVQFECYVVYNSGTGTGTLKITGLPFAAAGTTFPPVSCVIENITFTAGNYLCPYVQNGDTFILMVSNPTGGGARNGVSYDAAGEISIAGTYSV